MHKLSETARNLLVAGALLGTAAAQQTSGTAPSTPSASPRTGTTAAAAARRRAAAATPKPLVTDEDKASYAIGLSVGKGLHRDSINVEPEFVLQGLKDALADGKVQLTEEQYKAVMVNLQSQVRQTQEAKRQALIENNKKEGAAFLAANGSKAGVVTLPSGLQYKILTPGTGPKPTATDSVVCNYRGTLLDGTEFDSSYKRGQPATFPVTGVIKGWTEALQLMPTGSKWELYVPADLAYGERGQGPIGPNAMLIFDVELLSIQEKQPAAIPSLPTPATPANPSAPGTPSSPSTPSNTSTPSAPATPPTSHP